MCSTQHTVYNHIASLYCGTHCITSSLLLLPPLQEADHNNDDSSGTCSQYSDYHHYPDPHWWTTAAAAGGGHFTAISCLHYCRRKRIIIIIIIITAIEFFRNFPFLCLLSDIYAWVYYKSLSNLLCVLVIAPLGGMLLVYRPETRGRRVYKPPTYRLGVHN